MIEALGLTEIRTLCFLLEIDIDDFPPNLGKSGVVEGLIQYCYRHGRQTDLIAQARHLRPDLPWPEATETLSQALGRATFLEIPFELSPPPHTLVDRPTTAAIISQQLHQPTLPIIVGIYGSPGNGKSELASQLARQLREQFPDGVLRLNLSARDLDSALVRLAGYYGQETRMASIAATAEKARFLSQLLAPKKALLILDQADTNAELLEAFLPADSQTATLITTHHLAYLARVNEPIPLKPFSEAQSLQYLQASLGEARVMAHLEQAKRLHAAVGGMPLALRLATDLLASDVEFEEYLELFEHQETVLGELAELHGDARLTSALEISYSQLSAPRQQVFAALAVFEGLSFDVAAVAAVTGESSLKLKATLKALRDCSLITPHTLERSEINPLVRAFAHGKLADKTTPTYQRAADYFATRLAQSHIQNGYQDIDADWGNILGLLHWAETHSEWESFLRLVQGLIQPHLGVLGFLDLRGYWSDARRLLDKALTAATTLGRADLRLPLLVAAAGFAVRQSDNTAASDYLNQAEPLLPTSHDWASVIHWRAFRARLSQQTDPAQGLVWLAQAVAWLENAPVPLPEKDPWQGYLLSQQSTFYGMLGRYADCENAAQTSLTLLPPWPTDAKLVATNNLSILYYQTGRIEQGLIYAQQGIESATTLKNIQRLIAFWNACARSLPRLGRLDEALDYINQAIPVSQQIGHVHYESGFLVNRANIEIVQGRWNEALEALGRALHLAQTHHIHQVEVLTYSNLADVALARAEWRQAADYLAQGLAVCAAHGFPDLEITLLRQQLQVAQGQNQPEQVLQQVDGVLAKAEELQEQIDLGICLRLKGEALQVQGKVGALPALQQSVAQLEGQDVIEWACSRVALGRYYQQTGETALGRGEWEAASAVFTACGAKPDAERVAHLLARIAG
ncbi:MAG: NB-ARC domain-containing protein [Chloroflexi bacterium]|nr:NB-ARC domain-containing protein [Chloroflexota bacterium]